MVWLVDLVELVELSWFGQSWLRWMAWAELTLAWVGFGWVGFDWVGFDWVGCIGCRGRVGMKKETSTVAGLSYVFDYVFSCD